jgi:hypothetical protein
VVVGAAVLLLAGGLALSREAQGPFDELGRLALGLAIIVPAALGSALRFGQAPPLDERGYTAVVTVVIVTTLVTPPALEWSMGARTGSHGLTKPAA